MSTAFGLQQHVVDGSAPRGGVVSTLSVVIGRGRQRIAVTVRDEVAQVDSTVVVPVNTGRARP
ncbi:MAG: hypothetical protein V1750_03710 [Acidobacteriota bacterium]